MAEIGLFRSSLKFLDPSDFIYTICPQSSQQLADDNFEQIYQDYDYLNEEGYPEERTRFVGYSVEHIEARKFGQGVGFLHQVLTEGGRFLEVMQADMKRLSEKLKIMQDPSYVPSDSEEEQEGERSVIQI